MHGKKKSFDAVKMMREAREKISRDTQGMSFEKQKAYFKERAEKTRRRLETRAKTHTV